MAATFAGPWILWALLVPVWSVVNPHYFVSHPDHRVAPAVNRRSRIFHARIKRGLCYNNKSGPLNLCSTTRRRRRENPSTPPDKGEKCWLCRQWILDWATSITRVYCRKLPPFVRDHYDPIPMRKGIGLGIKWSRFKDLTYFRLHQIARRVYMTSS
ncbi:hypothetical protein CEXT_394971 [Caerostris extrusa]|uniref:Secreted protein n=1 Tax=Caerostris extrusa TaxID=172846 RepID=A0AAV4XRV2_CAEEX|nr:hypothetical protein CEXT_394971 [Caerostris extrusa]